MLGAVRESVVVLGLFVRAELLLRRRGVREVAERLGVRLSPAERSPLPPPLLPRWTRQRIAAAARVGRRWPAGPDGSCLRESLVLARRLRALDPEVCLGVRQAGGATAAHAWVFVAGGALDPRAGAFAQLPGQRP